MSKPRFLTDDDEKRASLQFDIFTEPSDELSIKRPEEFFTVKFI
jgi:hypothetical protein